MNKIIGILLLWMQITLVYKGECIYGSSANPYYLLCVSVLIPVYYFFLLLKNNIPAAAKPLTAFVYRLPGIMLGSICIFMCFPIFRNMLHDLPFPSTQSDVLPQLQGQYEAFARGDLPYYPLMQLPWHPYPVYMPLHWLPLGIGYLLHVDPRWSGYLLLVAAFSIVGYFTWKKEYTLTGKLIRVLLPVFVFYQSVMLDGIDMAATFETVIAAYYLLLATGLAEKNLPLVTAGIICCVLSRYTLLFWLPLFLLLLWFNVSFKRNAAVWASIIISVLLLYIFPFYIRDPSVLKKGLAYHNNAAIYEWHLTQSYIFQTGVFFGGHMHELFQGSPEHKVFMARTVQASFMIVLFIVACALYRRWKKKINFYDFSLGMLHIFLLFFFMFGPLTYTYYYFSLLMVSAVICGRIALFERKN